MATATDPWSWSVDAVIDALCVSRTSWIDARQLSRLPPSDFLEKLLKDNDVDGEVLLTDVDSSVLKEWDIKSLGQRSAIISIIRILRNSSTTYFARIKEESHSPPPDLPPTPIIKGHTFTASSQILPDTPTDVGIHVNQTTESLLGISAPLDLVDHQSQSYEVSGPTPGRAQEITIQDGTGNKRRKLDLTRYTRADSYDHSNTIDLSDHVHSNSSFLSDKALPVNKIFFGDAQRGQDLSDQDESTRGSCSFDFEIFNKKEQPAGCQLYVHRQLMHYFQNSTEYELRRGGRPACAKFPYRKSLLKKGSSLSALLVCFVDGKVIATREDARTVDQTASRSPSPEATHSEEGSSDTYWDFLKHWDGQDNTVLPVYGDSASEISLSESLIAEFEEDKNEQTKPEKVPLSQDEIQAIIDQATQQFVGLWQRKKLPLREHCAWTIWHKAKGARMRKSFANAAQVEVVRLERRLDKLKEDIIFQPWDDAAALKRLCASLEPTVFQLQEQLWRQSLWSLSKPPPKVETKIQIKKKVQVAKDEGSDGGDFLDGGSDEVASESSQPSNPEDNRDTLPPLAQPPSRDDGEGPRKSQTPPPVSELIHHSFDPSPENAQEDTGPPKSTAIIKLAMVDDSDSEEIIEDPKAPHTPSKRRVKEVKKDQVAVEKRNRAIARKKQQEARIISNQMIAGDLTRIAINTDCNDEDAFIYINENAAAKIKEHQVMGIQFLWRELITASMTDSESQGCLLAHTMGLGKTMQTITFLVTVSEAAQSSNPKISSQIPAKLRRPRILIVCPPSLIQNWSEEFNLWAPEPKKNNVGEVYTINQDDPLQKRLTRVSAWHHFGGVLILGYEMLISLDPLPGKADQQKPTSTAIQLREGPNIVVLDEAHVTRNKDSVRSKVCARFSTKYRIALSGTPLANNLEEYYAMINWVAPGYLGTLTEFKAHYKEPIEDGLYEESTFEERRKSLRKLNELNAIIGPKVLRADITVLEGEVPPKTEFVLKLPLTPLQEEAYKLYVQYVKGEHKSDANNTTVWAWLSVLCLLCNHPKLFIEKLNNPPKRALKAQVKVDGEPDSTTEHSNQGTSSDNDPLIKAQNELFEKHPAEVEKMVSSNKIKILMQILQHSKGAGEQLLVFSHSIPTLDYLEKLFHRFSISFARLDGTTKTSHRQSLTKEFSNGKFTAFLISTRAGGLGLNLVTATRVVLFDFCFNPTWEEQAIGRAYRLGQKKPVYVYRFLLGGTFEEKVNNTAIYKTQLATRAVDKKNPKSAASKYKDLIFAPTPVLQEPLTEYYGKDKLVLDKILDDTGNAILAITTTETLKEHVGDVDFTLEELQDAATTKENNNDIKGAS